MIPRTAASPCVYISIKVDEHKRSCQMSHSDFFPPFLLGPLRLVLKKKENQKERVRKGKNKKKMEQVKR